jgi:hypothetical protein
MHQKGEIALKNEIVRKLTSRKLWAALIAVAATFSTAIFKEQLDAETVELIGKGVVALCVYIFGEGIADAAGAIFGEVKKEK